MPQAKDKWIFLVILPLIAAVCLTLGYLRVGVAYTDAYSENGVWDLRGANLEDNLYRLMGEVEYVPDALLTPEAFAEAEGRQVGTPQHVARVDTSRLTVLVPPGTYLMAGHSIDYSEHMYVNGERLLRAGMPGLTEQASTPGTTFFVLPANGTGGVVEIVRQASNFVHRNGSNHAHIYIGPARLINSLVWHATWPAAAIAGFYAVLFLVHLFLFMALRSYRANLYLALFCLVWFLRTCVTNVKILTALFPSIPWHVAFRIEYLALPVSVLLFLLLFNSLFPGYLQKAFRYVAYGLTGATAAVFLFAHTLLMSHVIVAYYGVMGAIVLYVAVRTALKLRRADIKQAIMLAGVGVLFYSAVRDMFFYNDIYLFPSMAGSTSEVAMLIFVLFLMTALVYGTTQQMLQARQAEQRSRLEAENLRQLNRMKMEFLGELGHELKMPITVISGFAQYEQELLGDDVPDRAELLDSARRMEQEAGRMQQLVEQSLDMAAIEAGRLTLRRGEVRLAALFAKLGSTHFPMLDDGSNRLVEDCPPGLAVYADGDRVLQILVNLLSNACRHTHGGTITLAARAEGEMALVEVADTGAGIGEALLPHLFERYTKGGGTGSGLGLMISKKLVELQGGGITVQSAPGAGTKIRFTLPLFREEEDET